MNKYINLDFLRAPGNSCLVNWSVAWVYPMALGSQVINLHPTMGDIDVFRHIWEWPWPGVYILELCSWSPAYWNKWWLSEGRLPQGVDILGKHQISWLSHFSTTLLKALFVYLQSAMSGSLAQMSGKYFTVWSNLWNPLTIWTLLSFTVWPRCNYISSGSLHYKTIDMSLASLKIVGSGLIIIQWDSISLPLSQDTIKWLKLAGIQFFS